MTAVHEGLVAVRDTELFVTTTGTGPPMLVMHGGLGIDHTCLRPWLDALGDIAELVFYDHRGNGRSARPPLDEVDHATWVADADALRERLGHDQVVVLGHSYGGFLAMRYALAHPGRVRGLVLVSTAATMRHWDRILARLATPALVLGGRHDIIMPPEVTSEPLAAGLPDAELVVFEDSGHFPYIEEHDAFLRVVRRWLARLRS